MIASRLSRALGWISIGRGLGELSFAERLSRMLGVHTHEPLWRSVGARQMAAGVALLSLGRKRRRPRLHPIGVEQRRNPFAWPAAALGALIAAASFDLLVTSRGAGLRKRLSKLQLPGAADDTSQSPSSGARAPPRVPDGVIAAELPVKATSDGMAGREGRFNDPEELRFEAEAPPINRGEPDA